MMSIEIHLIYIAIIILISVIATVAAVTAKNAMYVNRGLREIYRKLDNRYMRAFRRLEIYTCSTCMDRAECQYAWNWHNIRGYCLKKKAEENNEQEKIN